MSIMTPGTVQCLSSPFLEAGGNPSGLSKLRPLVAQGTEPSEDQWLPKHTQFDNPQTLSQQEFTSQVQNFTCRGSVGHIVDL